MTPRTRGRLCFAPLLAFLCGGCAHDGLGQGALRPAVLRAPGAAASADPTVRGARILPAGVREDRSLGAEVGGGLRGIAAGVRVVSLPNGAMQAADERLPQVPTITTALPERLGGGFLFVLGLSVWRAEHWLSEARPIYASPVPIQRVIAGLDRVYLRAQNGSHQAIDGRSGARLDLGPWPGSPFVGTYAAVDGWRAVAINDLRGAVATFDAGGTWRPLALPMDAKEVALVGDMLVVGGLDRNNSWFEVRPDGQLAKLGALPTLAPAPPSDTGAGSGPHTFGKRPLLAALEDGWPLTDGTALVARDGALGRVRIADGALVESVADAFPLKPSLCHPIPLGRPEAPGAFGFACGEVRGKTVLYAFDPREGALTPLRQFAEPRVVVASGNGALAVRGPCSETAAPADEGAAQHSYCLRGRDGAWREIHVRGEIGGERLVVLADGRVAVISPPTRELTTARVTVMDGRKSATVPLTFHAALADPDAPLAADVARALRLGIWMDGFEERRPGVLGGWVETGGSVLGIEIQLDGSVAHGAYIKDAGTPMVSGRYGLGWSAAHRGFETTDGGMTWTAIEVPEPIADIGRPERGKEPRSPVSSRVCGPIGCNAAGWLRVGWGAGTKAATPDPKVTPRPPVPRPNLYLSLACEPLAPPPPQVPPPFPSRPARPAAASIPPRALVWGGTPVFGSPVSGVELPPFYSVSPPALHPDERGTTAEASAPIERYPQTGPLARLYAWGPKTGDWDHASRWVARWVWPYSGSQEVHATQISASPQLVIDAAKLGGGGPLQVPATWSLGIGDDPSHALLFARRGTPGRGDFSLFEVESDRAPLELHRADGEPLTEVDSAVRAAGHWFLAVPPAPGEMTATVLQVDGPVARELVRIPRAGMDGRPTPARLARRLDGRAIGFVVDGQPAPDRSTLLRWVLPIDLETGNAGEPEPLGPTDFADHAALEICSDEDAEGAAWTKSAWVLDVPWNISAHIYVGNQDAGTLHSLLARVRTARGHACLERIAGNLDAIGVEKGELLTRRAAGSAPPKAPGTGPALLSTTAFGARARYPMRCSYR